MRLIDADKLIIEVCKHKGCFATGEGNEPLMAWEVEDYINDAETADAAPVAHAHWIEDEDWVGDTIYTCSQCKDSFTLEVGTPEENSYFYCPHCGARMDGEPK